MLHLLTERGYSGVTIEQVAAAARVGKTAIYRRWASKPEMVFAVVVHDSVIDLPPDRGSLAADLRGLTERVLALLSTPAARTALPGLLADLRADVRLSERFAERFLDVERRLLHALLDRAVERGELTVRPSVVDVHAQLLGTVFAWIFLLTDELPQDLADRVSSAVLATLTTGEQQC